MQSHPPILLTQYKPIMIVSYLIILETQFELSIASDAVGSSFNQKSTVGTWFYFKVSKFEEGPEYTFTIANMANQSKLLNEGLQPVFKAVPGQNTFTRIPGPCSQIKLEKNILSFSFSFKFQKDTKEVFFAFTYPFSLEDYEKMTQDIQNMFPKDHETVYFHREVAGKSLDGNNLELITLTSRLGITSEREPKISNEFFPEISKNPRPFKYASSLFQLSTLVSLKLI